MVLTYGCGILTWAAITKHPMLFKRNWKSGIKFSVYYQNLMHYLFPQAILAISNPMCCLSGWKKKPLCCTNIIRMLKSGYHRRCSNPLANGIRNFMNLSTANTNGLAELFMVPG